MNGFRLGSLLGAEMSAAWKERERKIRSAEWEARKAAWRDLKDRMQREDAALTMGFQIRTAIEHVKPHIVYLQCSNCKMRPNCRKEAYQRDLDCTDYNG